MNIDWFTYGAQIVNFLILIFLLRKFLYGPVIIAMDKREETIASRLKEAKIKKEEAQQEAQKYQEEREDLQRRKNAFMEEARTEAEEHRKELMQEARREVEAIEKRWKEAISREQTSFLHDLSQRAESQIIAIGRRMLRDLANVDIEKQAIVVFFERLDELDEAERDEIRKILSESGSKLLIETRFEIEPDQQQKIIQALSDQFNVKVQSQFEVSSELGFGIELRVGGRKIAWSLDSYLGMLEDRITDALEEALEARIREEVQPNSTKRMGAVNNKQNEGEI